MLNVAETQKMFEENNIKFFLMSFVDLNGVPRAKLVPAECLADVADGAAGFAGFAVDGLGQGPHDPDLSCVPRHDSAVFPLPWKPGMAWVAGNLQMDGDNWDIARAAFYRVTWTKLVRRDFSLCWASSRSSFCLIKKPTEHHASPTRRTHSPSRATANCRCCATLIF
jgi:glutamine synthetase